MMAVFIGEITPHIFRNKSCFCLSKYHMIYPYQITGTYETTEMEEHHNAASAWYPDLGKHDLW